MSYRQPRKVSNQQPHQKLDPREVKAHSTASSKMQEDGERSSYLDQIYLSDEQGTRYQRAADNEFEIDPEQFITYDDVYDDVRRYQKKSYRTSSGRRITGKVLCYLQAAVSVVLIYLLIHLNILPGKILAITIAVIVVLWLLIFLSQRRNMRKIQAAGMIVSILLSAIMVIGALYLAKTNQMLQTMTGRTYDIRTYDLVVRMDDSAAAVSDVKDYLIAIPQTPSGSALADILADLSLELDTDLNTIEKASAFEEADALLNGEVGAAIYNDAFTSTILEQDPDYESKVKIIHQFTVKTENEIKSVDIDIKDAAFLVFISGNDSEGEISLTGRSDVNIVAGINTKSKEILLLTIPRDYYVEFPGITAEGERDKLTHSGIYGMDELLATVNKLLNCEINYYVRLNFSGMREIVNALGGVTIYNEQEFISNFFEYHYPQGWIYDMDGELTLRYVQERYAFEDGDFARGRHQVQVIQAMMEKLMTVNTLTNYNALADAIGSFAATNIPESDVKELIRIQLSENPKWHVVSYQLLGDVVYQPCQSANGMYLSVDMPYKEAVDNALILLDQLFSGETLSEDMQLTDEGQLHYIAQLIE